MPADSKTKARGRHREIDGRDLEFSNLDNLSFLGSDRVDNLLKAHI